MCLLGNYIVLGPPNELQIMFYHNDDTVIKKKKVQIILSFFVYFGKVKVKNRSSFILAKSKLKIKFCREQ